MVQEDLQCNGLLFYNPDQGEETSNIYIFFTVFQTFFEALETQQAVRWCLHTKYGLVVSLVSCNISSGFPSTCNFYFLPVSPQCLSLLKSTESLLAETTYRAN